MHEPWTIRRAERVRHVTEMDFPKACPNNLSNNLFGFRISHTYTNGMMSDDMALVREYAQRNSEQAFATLVTRHVNLVYSVALRQVRDPHLAQEITQSVFIILAGKAKSLSPKTILSGWFCRTARFVSANTLGIQRRRQFREQEAHMESTLNQPDSEAWNQIAPLLDDALGRLGEKEHDAVVLRFLDGKELKQVGAAMGISEDAARMRVNRGLEKLRGFFTGKGLTISTAAIAGAVSANSVQAAPAGLAAAITTAALSGTITTAVIAATKTVTITSMKTTVFALALAGGIAVLGYHQLNTQRQLRGARASADQQAEEIQALRTANEQLVSQTNELNRLREEAKDVLRLRAEVARLRQDQAALKKSADGLHVRTFRINPRAFLEKADSALGHPVNSTPTQITADYFASKGINLEPPKSVYLNTSNALLIARATDPELNAIESLLAESTPAQIHIEARFIEIPRQGFVMPSGIPWMKGNQTTGATAILGPAQFQVICKALEQREGVNLLAKSRVLTLSGRQCQIRTGDDAAPGQPAASGAIVNLIPNLSADGYTIKLKATVSAPETLNGEVNMYDHQTLLLSTTEKTKPDSQLIVLLTATLVDPVGKFVHADDELPFAQNGAPPQN